MYQDQTGKSPSKAGQKAEKPVILVAPLDWGLGHVTRCIPLVHELVKQGAAPVLAGNEAAKALLTEEFPHLPFLDLPGYDVRYAKTATGLFFNMIRQSGKILTAIKKEHKWLKDQSAVTAYILNEAKLAVVPFYAFGASKNSAWYRLSVGTCKKDEIEEMISKLGEALGKLK